MMEWSNGGCQRESLHRISAMMDVRPNIMPEVPMERFVTRHHDRIAGILTGFDRILFRGTLRSISHSKGAEIWLSSHRVLLKDFAAYAKELTARIKAHAEAVATAAHRPIEYLESSRISKEDYVRRIQIRDGITEGLICVLSCVEPCYAVKVRSDRATRRLGAHVTLRKCAHLYFYYADHDFGVMHIRLQTWFPFGIQICLNGREFLIQQLTRAGIAYQRADNCVTQVADLAYAQQLLDQLTTRRWARVLHQFAARVNPLVHRSAGLSLRSYYWSVQESEFATDVLFRTPADLAAVYPGLTRHAIDAFSSTDVLRFLGRRMAGRSTGEVTSSYLRRPEGLRVKHRVEENSIKMYDKAGCVLRIEVTINQPRRFLVYRERMRAGQRRRCWGKMRKGIADIPRRVELSRAANARYLDALSVVRDTTPIHQLFDPLSRRRIIHDRPYRPLRPIAPDESARFAALLAGHTAVAGCCAHDLRAVLSPQEPTDATAQKRLTGRVSRLLRLYRAHGLIAKITHTRRYRITPKGHQIMSTAIRCRTANLSQLAA